jgi:hypothetical protein
MNVTFAEQSDFDPVSAVKKLRLDFERRLLSGNGLRAANTERFTVTPIEKQETKEEPEEFAAPRRSPRASRNLVSRPRFFRLKKAPYRGRTPSNPTCKMLPLRWFRFLNLSNHSLTLIGITVLFFAILCIIRGWYSDLSLGFPIFISGLAMVAVGLSGRFLAR